MSGVKLVDGMLKLPKIKSLIKIKLTRPIESFSGVTLSRDNLNRYFVVLLTEVEEKHSTENHSIVGLDLGIKDFVIESGGIKHTNIKLTKKYSKRLATKQKKLSRKQKASRNRLKAKLKVGKVHKKISNSREDYLHKLSKKLVVGNFLICVEDLAVSNMIRNKKLSKAISDCAWGKFLTMLQYKSKLYGTKLVFVDRFFPSSKTCNNCGWKNKTLKLQDRSWKCQNCDTVHDRDLNAAINILTEGLRLWGWTTLTQHFCSATLSLSLWCKTLTELRSFVSAIV